MGVPVKIVDLATNMIRLSGLIEGQDIELVFTGLRPGEKLYEELLTDKESLKPSHNQLIFIAEKEFFTSQQLNNIDQLLTDVIKGVDSNDLVKRMKQIVPEFKSMNSTYTTLDK